MQMRTKRRSEADGSRILFLLVLQVFSIKTKLLFDISHQRYITNSCRFQLIRQLISNNKSNTAQRFIQYCILYKSCIYFINQYLIRTPKHLVFKNNKLINQFRENNLIYRLLPQRLPVSQCYLVEVSRDRFHLHRIGQRKTSPQRERNWDPPHGICDKLPRKINILEREYSLFTIRQLE